MRCSMDDYRECERCGKSPLYSIYVGDSLVGYLKDKDGGDSIDLCEECSNEIAKIINEWWNNGS